MSTDTYHTFISMESRTSANHIMMKLRDVHALTRNERQQAMIEPIMLVTTTTFACAFTIISEKVFFLGRSRAFFASLLMSSGIDHITFFLMYGVSGLGALYGVAFLGYAVLSSLLIIMMMTISSILPKG